MENQEASWGGERPSQMTKTKTVFQKLRVLQEPKRTASLLLQASADLPYNEKKKCVSLPY